MYKIKAVLTTTDGVIRHQDRGSRTLVLRIFAEAQMWANNGAKVKVVVRAPDGRVTKHTFKGEGYAQQKILGS